MAPEKLRKLELEEEAAAVSATEYKKHARTEPPGWVVRDGIQQSHHKINWIECFLWYFVCSFLQKYSLVLFCFAVRNLSMTLSLFFSYSALSPGIQPDGYMRYANPLSNTRLMHFVCFTKLMYFDFIIQWWSTWGAGQWWGNPLCWLTNGVQASEDVCSKPNHPHPSAQWRKRPGTYVGGD